LHYGLTKNNYTLAQMQADGGNVASNPTDLHSVVNPQIVMYSNVSNQVSESNFVKFLQISANTQGQSILETLHSVICMVTWSRVPQLFRLSIQKFYSMFQEILIPLVLKITSMSHLSQRCCGMRPVVIMPVVQNANFTVNETKSLPAYIGTVSADDPDHAQGLTFSIISGNENNMFSINSAGSIYFTSTMLTSQAILFIHWWLESGIMVLLR
jgi:hypothetical protein